MKNYTYRCKIKDRGLVEVVKSDYTARQIDMDDFIKSMSSIIGNAKCGWDGVRYEIMHNMNGYTEEYMVLYCAGGERWIPIRGNSKGCNFSVLGENLW